MVLGNLQEIAVNKQSLSLPHQHRTFLSHVAVSFYPALIRISGKTDFWLYWSHIRFGFYALIFAQLPEGILEMTHLQ